MGVEITDEVINWQKDKEEDIAAKIKKREGQSKTLHDKKMTEYKTADAYFDGRPDLDSLSKEKMIANLLLPIIRNMVGLTSDPRPHPSCKLGRLPKDAPQEDIKQLLELANATEESLDEWWEDNKMQSLLQRTLLGLYTYSDYFWLAYWNPDDKDACMEPFSPRRVLLDPNCDDVGKADYAIVYFYRSRAKMYEQFGEEKCKDLKYADYKEVIDVEMSGDNSNSPSNGTVQIYANVCKLKLYMEKDWWVYKVDDKILEKKRAPYWAPDEAAQQEDLKTKLQNKYKKPGIAGVAQKGMDMVKGAVGMETMEEKMGVELDDMMKVFTPKANYLKRAKIPLIQFDTYRFAGENYSRSTMMQSVPLVDDINTRKHSITGNSETIANPATVVDGAMYNETDAQKLKDIRRTGDVARLDTRANKSLRESVVVLNGEPLPAQFFEDIQQNKRDLDNLWGHHEASKGAASAANPTKGGILALQEADQTPIRYITRSIEDSLQEVFNWVIQIRKMYLEDDGAIDYSKVDQRIKTFVKSGSMMPTSKEQQRAQAIELYRISAIDPLTLHERLETPNPEEVAQRLSNWLRAKEVMVNGPGGVPEDQKQRVMMKLQLIQRGEFDKVEVLPDDEPKIHHDILLMALKSNQFDTEQEKVLGDLIARYEQLAKGAGPAPAAGGQPAPVMANPGV